MKFAILNDETTETWKGGAALVNEKIQAKLIKEGHECDIVTYNGKDTEDKKVFSEKEWKPYDFFIFANIAYFPEKEMYEIMEHKPFVTFRHDIPIILYTQPPSIRFSRFYKLFGTMFEKAKMSFFISPMQYKIFDFNFKLGKSMILPPPLDIDGFVDEKKEDRKGCLYVGDIGAARGCIETLNFMKQQDKEGPYTFVGAHVDTQIVDALKEQGATVLNPVEHDEVPAIMNMHKDLYYFPQIYDSFCLKMLEAHMCGMNLMSDHLRIGLFSYGTKMEDIIEAVKNKSIEGIYEYIMKEDEPETTEMPATGSKVD